MTYYGVQFRMARAALGLSMREVCAEARLSFTTAVNIEAAGAIEYGVRQAGRFEEGTISKLVLFFEEQGVTFLQASAHGPGIRAKD
jgi:hypothetical protein